MAARTPSTCNVDAEYGRQQEQTPILRASKIPVDESVDANYERNVPFLARRLEKIVKKDELEGKDNIDEASSFPTKSEVKVNVRQKVSEMEAKLSRLSKPSPAQKQREKTTACARKGTRNGGETQKSPTCHTNASKADVKSEGKSSGVPAFADTTKSLQTNKKITLAERMRRQSEMIESGERDSVSIYKIPTTVTMRKQNEKLVKKCLKDPLQGRKPSVGGKPQEKVLMVMGATGAGKSTLINGMINYIMGVEWDDKFRFKLIDDSSSSQGDSVTTEITAYTIPPIEGSALPYTFTIIDTPGYGDTKGLKRDITITKQIKEFFSLGRPDGIDHLDGIGFVINSSLPRLTSTQTYIFDAILSIFGKDMGDNIFMMVTFADGHHPPVLTAVKKANVSYQNFFKFNNSALFAPNAISSFDHMYWQMGKKSFEDFFAHLQFTKSVKLEQTNNVLDERERLEVLVEGLNPQIKEGLAKLEEMRHEKMALQGHESQMEHNKDFVFTVPTLKTTQIDLQGTGRHTTTCLKCSFTCHKDCKIADNSRKKECVAIDDDNGNCKVCTGKCYWNFHKNVPYLLEHRTVFEQRTSEDLKKKYDMGMQGKNKVEAMLTELENVYCNLRNEVLSNMYKVRLCLYNLDKIALKANPLTELDYIELLIEAEKNERDEGWMNRVRAYEEVKNKHTILAKIQRAEDIPMLVNEILPKQERFSECECVIQ